MAQVTIFELLFKVNVVPDIAPESSTKGSSTSKEDDDCCSTGNDAAKELLDEFAGAMESGVFPGVKTTKR